MFKIAQVENLSDLGTAKNMVFVGGLSTSLLVKKEGDTIEPTMLDYGITSGAITAEKLYFANLDHEVHELDLKTLQKTKIGVHDYLITQMINTPYGLVTLALDKKIKLDNKHTITVNETPLRMTYKDNNLDIALMDKTRITYDMRHLDKPLDTNMVGLKYMVRDMIHHKTDIAYSSIEGRVQCSESFAFKCHRKKVGNREYIYPVHALSSANGLLVTGGSDGFICYWDVEKRKRSKITDIGGSIYRMTTFGDELAIGTEEGKVVTVPV
eukprot:NODE_286_length_11757_cov_0.187768.p6 type:complete len:268 gc:universal NODE_286_length_11757_cov_0.187768:3052-3855(+)